MDIPITPEVEVPEAPLPELQEAQVPKARVEAETLEAPPLTAQPELAVEVVVDQPIQGMTEDPLCEAGLQSIGSFGKAVARSNTGDASSKGDGSSPAPPTSHKRPRKEEVDQLRVKVPRHETAPLVLQPTASLVRSHGGSQIYECPIPQPSLLGSEVSGFRRAERRAAKEYIHKTLQSLKAHLESIHEKGTGMGRNTLGVIQRNIDRVHLYQGNTERLEKFKNGWLNAVSLHQDAKKAVDSISEVLVDTAKLAEVKAKKDKVTNEVESFKNQLEVARGARLEAQAKLDQAKELVAKLEQELLAAKAAQTSCEVVLDSLDTNIGTLEQQLIAGSQSLATLQGTEDQVAASGAMSEAETQARVAEVESTRVDICVCIKDLIDSDYLDSFGSLDP